MRGPILIVVGTLVCTAGVVAAQEKPRIEQAPIQRVSPVDGKEMFASYCAACHGKEGRGDGPAAAALTKAPADLTRLSARNGGKYPETKVKRYIEGADEVPAHGSRDMPMWGSLFRALNRDTALLRVEALSNHLQTLQRP